MWSGAHRSRNICVAFSYFRMRIDTTTTKGFARIESNRQDRHIVKNKVMYPLLVWGLALLAPCISAQKLDCNKPISSAEQAECAHQELTAAEADLKEALSGALQQYSESSGKENTPLPKSEEREQRDYDAKMRGSILASQKAWIQYRTAACQSVAMMYDGGTISASAVPSCQAALTRERAKFLRDYFGEK
jgi:uncharacterized protein YecT (DUF1311 family)